VTRLTRILLIIGPTIAVATMCAFALLQPVPVQHHHRAPTAGACGKPPLMHHLKFERPYIGLITGQQPGGTGLANFARATGTHPNLVAYFVPFGSDWDPVPICRILRDGALPLIQIDPTKKVSVARIAGGKYDGYLERYARHLRNLGQPIAIGFGHEMNGTWYPWGYHHVSPKVFVAAWRHIVRVFRAAGAYNVKWVWTVNIVDPKGNIPSPVPWWPGGAYVDWVGIDGYYYKPSWTFPSLFGPTIKAVRSLTLDPIIIAETAADPNAGQAAKIANLFAGVQEYGLLGFVWFDSNGNRGDWYIDTQQAYAAFGAGARTLTGAGS
jgi:mannan endo-1,4-beta-mannosidase